MMRNWVCCKREQIFFYPRKKNWAELSGKRAGPVAIIVFNILIWRAHKGFCCAIVHNLKFNTHLSFPQNVFPATGSGQKWCHTQRHPLVKHKIMAYQISCGLNHPPCSQQNCALLFLCKGREKKLFCSYIEGGNNSQRPTAFWRSR